METDYIRILLVEDNPGDVRLLSEILRDGTGSYSLNHVSRIAQAQDRLKQESFDVMLLDLSLPDSSGLDTVIKICGAAPHLPIVVLTGLEDDAFAIETVHAGAQDYLLKGQINHLALTRAMRYAIERKKMEERLYFMATHDLLTNLPNRNLFQDRLAQSIERSKRNHFHNQEKWEIAIMVLDLDHFKVINDTYGHLLGDALLQAAAMRLQDSVRRTDTVARLGGDEFILIFENLDGMEDARLLAEKIKTLFSQTFRISDQEFHITASFGISLFPTDGQDFESLTRSADMAMYVAKQQRNCYSFYGPVIE